MNPSQEQTEEVSQGTVLRVSGADGAVEGSPCSRSISLLHPCAAPQASMFLGIFLCLGVLIFGFLLVFLLRRYSVSWFPEAWAFFLLGLAIAGVSSSGMLPGLHPVVQQLRETFPSLFFVMLLPPIIFESGFSLDKAAFFSNFGAICLYALLGTFVSCGVVGTIMWALGLAGAIYPVGLLDALTFGAIISATDPVTVLAVFQELGVDRTLYALIFGESVLNDAVAIVLLHTLLTFQTEPIQAGSIAQAALGFSVVFVGSLLIGVAAGVIGALLFKHVALRARHRPIERVLFALLPFVAYMLAEALRLSGVVAILFSGIATSHYTARNVTASTRRFSRVFFRMLASIAEALVFVSIGVAMPTTLFRAVASNNQAALWAGLLAVAVGRLANVRVSTALANAARPAESSISAPFPFVMWFSGLRGGVAFALAASAKASTVDQEWAEVQETVCLFIVVVTMTTIGGTVGPLARGLGITHKPLPGSGAAAVGARGVEATAYDGAFATAMVAVDGTAVAAGGGQDGEPATDSDAAKARRWSSRRKPGRERPTAGRAGGAMLAARPGGAGGAASDDDEAWTASGATESGAAPALAAGAASAGGGSPGGADGPGAAGARAAGAGSAARVEGGPAPPAARGRAGDPDEVLRAVWAALYARAGRAAGTAAAVSAIALRGCGIGLGAAAERRLGVRTPAGRAVGIVTYASSGRGGGCAACGGRAAWSRACPALCQPVAAGYDEVPRSADDGSPGGDQASRAEAAAWRQAPVGLEAAASAASPLPSRKLSRRGRRQAGRAATTGAPRGREQGGGEPAVCAAAPPESGGDEKGFPLAASEPLPAQAAGDGTGAAASHLPAAPAPGTPSQAGGAPGQGHPLTVGEALRRDDGGGSRSVVRSLLGAAPSLQDLARFDSRVLTPLFTSAAEEAGAGAAGRGGTGAGSAGEAGAASAVGDTTGLEGGSSAPE